MITTLAKFHPRSENRIEPKINADERGSLRYFQSAFIGVHRRPSITALKASVRYFGQGTGKSGRAVQRLGPREGDAALGCISLEQDVDIVQHFDMT